MGCIVSGEKDAATALIDDQAKKDHAASQHVIRLLLLGAGESGKTTLFKQMVRMYGEGFTDIDRKRFQNVVVQNAITAIQALLRAYQHPDIRKLLRYKLSSDLKKDAELLLHMHYDETVTKEAADLMLKLWAEPAIQEVYSLRALFQLTDSAAYMIENIHRFISKTYASTDEDMLLARIKTTGIVETDFTIDSQAFHMMDVGGQKNERKKWMHHFEGVTAMIFVAAISEYDQMMYEDSSMNRMHDSIKLFSETCNSRWFEKTDVLLFLNKRDLFEVKIQTVPLSVCFPEWDDYYSKIIEAPDAIEHKFEFLQHKYDETMRNDEKEVYCHVTCATDENNVRFVFEAVKDIVVKSMLRKGGLF